MVFVDNFVAGLAAKGHLGLRQSQVPVGLDDLEGYVCHQCRFGSAIINMDNARRGAFSLSLGQRLAMRAILRYNKSEEGYGRQSGAREAAPWRD